MRASAWLAHCGKEHHLADRRAAGEDHDEAVDPDAHAARRRHSVLERADEVLIVRLRLLVAGRALPALLLEAGALLVRIVQLAERVRELHPGGEALEALDEPRLRAVRLSERRQLDRAIEHKSGAPDVRLDVLRQEGVDRA